MQTETRYKSNTDFHCITVNNPKKAKKKNQLSLLYAFHFLIVIHNGTSFMPGILTNNKTNFLKPAKKIHKHNCGFLSAFTQILFNDNLDNWTDISLECFTLAFCNKISTKFSQSVFGFLQRSLDLLIPPHKQHPTSH